MPPRTVLALLVAPLAAALVYALAQVATSPHVRADILFGSVVMASIVGVLFEVLTLAPLTLAVRVHPRARVHLFLAGSLVWFAVSLAMWFHLGWSSAVAMAVQLLLPGIILVAVFAAFVGLREHA